MDFVCVPKEGRRSLLGPSFHRHRVSSSFLYNVVVTYRAFPLFFISHSPTFRIGSLLERWILIMRLHQSFPPLLHLTLLHSTIIFFLHDHHSHFDLDILLTVILIIRHHDLERGTTHHIIDHHPIDPKVIDMTTTTIVMPVLLAPTLHLVVVWPVD